MISARRAGSLPTVICGVVLLAVLMVATGGLTADRAARAEEGNPGNLSVDVSDGIDPPAAAPGRPPITPPGRSITHIQGPGAAGPPAAPAAPALGETDLGGVLFVGGLAGGYSTSLNPLAGELQVWFTVRNVSKSTIDATADFWLEGPFGHRISQVDDVEVVAVKPGEKRTISAVLPGVGQWTFVTAHTTFTPPEKVDNAELSSFTRDVNVFAPPWFIAAVFVVVLGIAVVRTFLRRIEVPVRLGEVA
ncbi:hypothetical protein [Agromyces humatus]|uniref:DUF916 domain-containing protein n=1 Tax=Agromyces humatus TaxID=279573 RepID=A0ABP4WPQ4_9MICO|nr:hypothetical protein [Agromyces humatus]